MNRGARGIPAGRAWAGRPELNASRLRAAALVWLRSGHLLFLLRCLNGVSLALRVPPVCLLVQMDNKPFVTFYALDQNGKIERQVRLRPPPPPPGSNQRPLDTCDDSLKGAPTFWGSYNG